jgi:hypothetical protein
MRRLAVVEFLTLDGPCRASVALTRITRAALSTAAEIRRHPDPEESRLGRIADPGRRCRRVRE